MFGILIQYDYDGDEGPWLAAVEDFVTAIDGDEELRGKFSYRVNIAADGVRRVHVGQWDSDETLSHLQSQDFFKQFAAKVGEFSGGGPDASRMRLAAETTA